MDTSGIEDISYAHGVSSLYVGDSERRGNGTHSNGDSEATDPMAFNMNFGLAGPLKDTSTFNYDDPLLYENVHITDNAQLAPNEPPFVLQSGSATPNWGGSQWNLPGLFRPLNDDSMDLDTSPSFAPGSYYDAVQNGVLGETINETTPIISSFVPDADPGPIDAFDRFEFSVLSSSGRLNNGIPNFTDQNGTFQEQERLQILDADFSRSYVSEDISPDQNTDHLLAYAQSQFHDATSVFGAASETSPFAAGGYRQTTPNGDEMMMFQADSGDLGANYLGDDFARSKDDTSHRTSILGVLNDLLPLTTTSSFTPSATSLHLTQPSYFSAHQFMRLLMEQPPSLIGRASLDFYLRRRPSIESIHSGPNAPVRSQRSLASYFHFRERDRKLPLQPGPMTPETTELTQSRHSIRSIFKTSNNAAQSGENNTFAVVSEHETVAPSFVAQSGGEDSQLSDVDTAVTKKNKRSKRNLFTRFKPTKTHEFSEVKLEQTNEGTRLENVSELETQSDSKPQDILATKPPQSRGTSTSLQHVDSTGLINADILQEPDYAALFAGVGKRRNLVSIKGKKKSEVASKADAAIKLEADSEKALNPSLSSNDPSADCRLVGSVANSLHSFNSKESNAQEQTPVSGPLAFANASKRILGSRLMKKKNSSNNNNQNHGTNKGEPTLSDLVEIDLQSLDLPENTEILSDPLLLSKTRGRKEDKAADMEDQSKIFVCGYCDRRFKRQEHLKRHFRSLHTAQKPYDCSICQKKFSRTDNLAQHLKVHKQEEEEQAALRASAE